MSKDIKPQKINAQQYKQQKANCNRYEREWRKTHPKEHKENSKQLLTAIRKVKATPRPKK